MKSIKKRLSLTLLIFSLHAVLSHAAPHEPAHKIRIALFDGEGAHPRPQIFTVLQNQPNMTLTTIDADDIRHGVLKDYDVLFVPGGSAVRESRDIMNDGRNEIRHFVHNGGIYIGVCAGSYFMSESKPMYLGLLPIKTVDPKNWKRGKAMLTMTFTPLGMQILKPPQSTVKVLYHNGPVFEKIQANDSTQNLTTLATYRDEVVHPGGEPGLMVGAPAIVLGRYGDGIVMGISPHPEATPDLENIEKNAIEWMVQQKHKKQQAVR